MTYNDLLIELQGLSNEQLYSQLTVELDWVDEYYPASLRICDKEHDVLDENHPVIYVA
jgi:hypothetical protein